jgi:hypothetical protein
MSAADSGRRGSHSDPASEGPPQAVAKKSRRLKRFTAALDRAARAYLVARGVAPAERYRLVVERCPVHSAWCARVTYGICREHIKWVWADVSQVAATLLETMLTQAPAGAAVDASGTGGSPAKKPEASSS